MFLNSHEHIHMLPVLFGLTVDLAQKYRIPYVRLTKPEWLLPMGGSALIRNTLMQCMFIMNRQKIKVQQPVFLGLSKSGKLDFDYLDRIFSKLTPGKSYELMCHPGYFDANEIKETRLTNYHDWESELALLQSPKLPNLYEKYSICLGYYQN